MSNQMVKHQELILEAIDQLRRRKSRPDAERIYNCMFRRKGVGSSESKLALERCVENGIVLRVSYKGNISYRNAAKKQERQSLQLQMRTKKESGGGGGGDTKRRKFTNMLNSAFTALVLQDPDYLEAGVPPAHLVRTLLKESENIKYTKRYIWILLQKEVESGGLIRLRNGHFLLGNPGPEAKGTASGGVGRKATLMAERKARYAERRREKADERRREQLERLEHKRRHDEHDSDENAAADGDDGGESEGGGSRRSVEKRRRADELRARSYQRRNGKSESADEDGKEESSAWEDLKCNPNASEAKRKDTDESNDADEEAANNNSATASMKSSSSPLPRDESIANGTSSCSSSTSAAVMTVTTTSAASATSKDDGKAAAASSIARPSTTTRVHYTKRVGYIPKRLREKRAEMKRSAENLRVGGRRKKAKKVFDPSDANMPKRRGRPLGSKTGYKKADIEQRPESRTSLNGDRIEGGVCSVCHKQNKRGLIEKLISCRECSNKAHASCLNGDDMMLKMYPDNTWQCPHCKTCVICYETSDAGHLVVCSVCADPYHNTCHTPRVDKVKANAKWLCKNCQMVELVVEDIHHVDKQAEEQPPQQATTVTTQPIISPEVSRNSTPHFESSPSSPTLPMLSPQMMHNGLHHSSSESDNKSDITISRDEEAAMDEHIDEAIPDASNWSTDDVTQYFEKYFPDEAQVFKEQEIDGHSLLLMRRMDVLKGLHLRLGPALKIYRHVLKLQYRRDDPKLYWA